MNILNPHWKHLLIKGSHNSGKSDVTLWLISQLLRQSKDVWLNHLLDEQEKILMLTENTDQMQLISMNLANRIHVVENISTKNPLEFIQTYHQQYGIEVVVIDYINLLQDFSNQHPYVLGDMLEYMRKNHIRWIFVESKFKLLKENLKVDEVVDYILETEKVEKSSTIEIQIKKEDGIRLPDTQWKKFRVTL